MVFNFKKILVIIFLLPVFGSKCKKNIPCGNINIYNFRANYVNVSPDLDSIHIGDTIWINYNLPKIFRDTITNQMIDYSNAENFGNFISELKFTGGSISDPGSEYAVGSFMKILLIGNLAQDNFPMEGQAYTFLENSNSYTLKVGLIPESLGVFAFSINDASGVVGKGNQCNNASFAFSFINTNQHLYLYQNNRPGYIISDYEALHLYCFKVY